MQIPFGNDKQRGGTGVSSHPFVVIPRRESASAFAFRVVIPEGNPLLFCFLPADTPVTISTMRREYDFWVYIFSSRSRSLYIGVTNNLRRRTSRHREACPGTHTAKYNIHRLVYYEHHRYVINALTRETELKHWTRAQKIALIESVNPTWEDLAVTLYPELPPYPREND